MQVLLCLISLAALIAGFVLRVVAKRHRTALGATIPWYSVTFWKYPPWKASEVLTPRGMELHFTSTVLIMAGATTFVIAMLISKR